MNQVKGVVQGVTVLALLLIQGACVVAEPREGYYDHDHARYYHEHSWHECHDRDEYCR